MLTRSPWLPTVCVALSGLGVGWLSLPLLLATPTSKLVPMVPQPCCGTNNLTCCGSLCYTTTSCGTKKWACGKPGASCVSLIFYWPGSQNLSKVCGKGSQCVCSFSCALCTQTAPCTSSAPCSYQYCKQLCGHITCGKCTCTWFFACSCTTCTLGTRTCNWQSGVANPVCCKEGGKDGHPL
jgi:hypothetical protein